MKCNSHDPKNIFDLQNREYPEDNPEPNGKMDPLYSLFERYPAREAVQEMAFFTDTSICIGCKSCEVACKQWNQLPVQEIRWSGNSYDNTYNLSALNWRHVKFVELL